MHLRKQARISGKKSQDTVQTGVVKSYLCTICAELLEYFERFQKIFEPADAHRFDFQTSQAFVCKLLGQIRGQMNLECIVFPFFILAVPFANRLRTRPCEQRGFRLTINVREHELGEELQFLSL